MILQWRMILALMTMKPPMDRDWLELRVLQQSLKNLQQLQQESLLVQHLERSKELLKKLMMHWAHFPQKTRWEQLRNPNLQPVQHCYWLQALQRR